MKRILRIFLIHIAVIYFASQIASGIEFKNYTEGIIVTGLALGLASFTVKPIVKILLLPITLATAGVFGFLTNVITLYIVDYAVPEFTISKFHFPGLKSTFFDLPKLEYSGVLAYIAFAILISMLVGLINWIRK